MYQGCSGDLSLSATKYLHGTDSPTALCTHHVVRRANVDMKRIWGSRPLRDAQTHARQAHSTSHEASAAPSDHSLIMSGEFRLNGCWGARQSEPLSHAIGGPPPSYREADCAARCMQAVGGGGGSAQSALSAQLALSAQPALSTQPALAATASLVEAADLAVQRSTPRWLHRRRLRRRARALGDRRSERLLNRRGRRRDVDLRGRVVRPHPGLEGPLLGRGHALGHWRVAERSQ